MKRTPSLLCAALVVLVGCTPPPNEFVPPPPPEVTVSRPVQLKATPFVQENGNVESVEDAEVRARVSGFVYEILFKPGQVVEQDQTLYRIEPDRYRSILDSAEAEIRVAEASIGVANAMVAVAKAEAERADLEMKRQTQLMERGAGSKTELEASIAADRSAKAQLQSAEAQVEAAKATKGQREAARDKAKLDVDYTEVKSLIAGRVSKTDVKQGNLIDEGGLLATVTDSREVFVNFSISDREMLRYTAATIETKKQREAYEKHDWSEIKVFAKLETDDTYKYEGVLDYVDIEGVDPSTGTLGLRARFDNKSQLLVPGLFVSVRMPSGQPKDSLLLPEYAVLRDQRGQYVLTIGGDKKVERADVKVQRRISGWALIESGIDENTDVITVGIQRSRPGLEVTPSLVQLEVTDEALMRGLSPRGESLPKTSEDKPEADSSASADKDGE